MRQLHPKPQVIQGSLGLFPESETRANLPSHHRYVPVVQAIQSDLGGLRGLTPAVWARTTPLLEIGHRLFAPLSEREKVSIPLYLRGVAQEIVASIPTGVKFYVDVANTLTRYCKSPDDFATAIRDFFRDLLQHDCHVIPVISTTYSIAHQLAIADAAEFGCAVRLSWEQFDDLADADPEYPGELTETLLAELEMFRMSTGLPWSGIDLILDRGTMGKLDARNLESACEETESLSMLQECRSFTLLVCDLSSDGREEGKPVHCELTPDPNSWHMWGSLLASPGAFPRIPTYGDYVFFNRGYWALEEGLYSNFPTLRYTTTRQTLVVTGLHPCAWGNPYKYGYGQYAELARAIVERPEYLGEDYSWGDRYLARCAHGQEGVGNGAIWQKVGLNHHITLVAREIARLATVKGTSEPNG